MSTRGRYGLRAMLELARCHGKSPVLMADLAQREDLSRKYLHALLTTLKGADLVRSVRGAAGGFVLSRPPPEIKLSEILHALEGSLSIVDCVADKRACDKADGCTARSVWQGLSGVIENTLDSVTLEDLILQESSARTNGKSKGKDGTRRQKDGISKASHTSSRSKLAKARKT